MWLPRWHSGEESTCQFRRCKRSGFDLWVGKIPWSMKCQPTPVFCLINSMDRRAWQALPWGWKESDARWANTHTHTHTQWQDFKIPEFMEFLDDQLRIWMFYVSLTAQCNNKLKKNCYVHYMKMCLMKKFLWLCGKWEFFMLDRLIFWKYMAASFIFICMPVISIYFHTRYYGILYSLPTVFINFSSRGEDYVHSKSSYN